MSQLETAGSDLGTNIASVVIVGFAAVMMVGWVVFLVWSGVNVVRLAQALVGGVSP